MNQDASKISNAESMESYLDSLDRDFCHLVIFGARAGETEKIRHLIQGQGLRILDDRIFPHKQQAGNLVDFFVKLQPCAVGELIMELSGAGIQGRFQGYRQSHRP